MSVLSQRALRFSSLLKYGMDLKLIGGATGQAVCRWFFIAVSWLQSHADHYGICGGRNVSGTDIPSEFPFSFIIIVCPQFYTSLSSWTDRTEANTTSNVKLNAVFTTHTSTVRFNVQ